MVVENDGSWEPIGSELRERLRGEYQECGEGCVYTDMVRFKDHRPTDWQDHDAVHAVQAIVPRDYTIAKDIPEMREAIREEFLVHRDSYDKVFADERDSFADRKAIVALRGLHAFIAQSN